MRPKTPRIDASSISSKRVIELLSPEYTVARPCFCLMKYWLKFGVQVRANAREVSKETETVTANALKKVAVTPVMAISGMKTTIGVTVDPISGTVISLRALRI